MTYVSDRFRRAVKVLAGNGHLKQRLIVAYENHLEDIADDELPQGARSSFASLQSLMHRVAPLNGEGPIRASVRKMSLAEAQHCAELIVGIFASVTTAREDRERPSLVAVAEQAADIPSFLTKS